MTDENQNLLEKRYQQYNDPIRPLIAEIQKEYGHVNRITKDAPKYSDNPEQFEIIWLDGTGTSKWYGSGPLLKVKKKYCRFFIRKKAGA